MRAVILAWLPVVLAAHGCHGSSSIPQRPLDPDAQAPLDAQAPKESQVVPDAGTEAVSGGGHGGSAGQAPRTAMDARSKPVGGTGGGGRPAPSTDAAQAPDTSPPETQCTTVGALRCAGTGMPARQQCQNGSWIGAADCETGSVCDSTDSMSPGTCKPAAQHCVGAAGKSVCVGAELHRCSLDGVDTGSTPCDSERLCQQGKESGSCSKCVIGTFECQGAQLRACKADGSGYEDKKACDTAALCNALVGECTSGKCAPTTKSCEGDDLQKCNADQTGFVLEKMCGAGLCDMANGQCDLCFPGAKDCSANAPRTCNPDGQGYTSGTACSGAAGICRAGACIECLSASDCSTGYPCLRPTCNTGNGSCGTAFLDPHAPCSGGVCDGAGRCIECVDHSDCTGAKKFCSSGQCVGCLTAANCSQPENACKQAECVNQSCVSSNKDDTATCNAGGGKVCDGAGNCVPCNVHGDCNGGFCMGHQCQQCRSAADCRGTMCAPATCVNGSCGTMPLDGNGCGDGMVCNRGTCQPACGNGRVDTRIVPAEECDPKAAGYTWYNCDPANCQKRTWYTPCQLDGECDNNCWNETNSNLLYCAPACSVDADCPKFPGMAQDRVFCANRSCAIDCTNGNDASCPPQLKCQRSGPVGACIRR